MDLYRLTVKRELVSESPGPLFSGTCVRKPSDVSRVAKTLIGDEDQEVFVAFYLDIKNRIVGFAEVGRGSVESCPADPRVILRTALLTPGCCSIIACHNHPSGDPSPSQDDLVLTKKLSVASALMAISLLDHLIVSPNGSAYSMLENDPEVLR